MKNPWNRHRIKRKRSWKSNQELERVENITYTTENIKNNRKFSTGKYGKNIRVQLFEESIEEVVAEEIKSIRTRAKQQEYDDVTKEVSNSQLQQETMIEDGQRKEKAEEPKYF